VKKFLNFHFKDYNIYVKGLEKGKWLNEIIEQNVNVLSQNECGMKLSKIVEIYSNKVYCENHNKFYSCVKNEKEKTFVCSLKNVLALRKFIEIENPIVYF